MKNINAVKQRANNPLMVQKGASKSIVWQRGHNALTFEGKARLATTRSHEWQRITALSSACWC